MLTIDVLGLNAMQSEPTSRKSMHILFCSKKKNAKKGKEKKSQQKRAKLSCLAFNCFIVMKIIKNALLPAVTHVFFPLCVTNKGPFYELTISHNSFFLQLSSLFPSASPVL